MRFSLPVEIIVISCLMSFSFSTTAAKKSPLYLKPWDSIQTDDLALADANATAADFIRYDTNVFTQMPIDHFNVDNVGRFSIKYLYNMDHYKPGGPLFFYTGNEGKIEGFAKNTGILFELAPLLNAAIIFAEHRYYSIESSPFGKDSTTSLAKLQYLSSKQALADYAHMIPPLKAKFNISESAKVIAVGGSYGGMLSAWFRMKYPHIVHGAWAASAPILYFRHGGLPYTGFDAVAREVLDKSGCDYEVLKAGFDAVKIADLKLLNEMFAIDKKSELTNRAHVSDLIGYIDEAFTYAVMTDYPYETEFLQPLPAWPAEKMCKFITNTTDDLALIGQLRDAANVFYNTTGALRTTCVRSDVCDDAATSSLDLGISWQFQYCSEMTIAACGSVPVGSSNETECQESFVDNTVNDCVNSLKAVDIDFRSDEVGLDAVEEYYGLSLESASNIIFTNGDLDPWHAGGVSSSTPGFHDTVAAARRGLFNFLISGGAHHLDLRQPNTCDPPAVIDTRVKIVQILKCWSTDDVSRADCAPLLAADFAVLPSFKRVAGAADGNCTARTDGYPWPHSNGAAARYFGVNFAAIIAVGVILLAFIL